MAVFVENVERLLKERGIQKKQFLSDLNLNKNAFSVWKKRGNIPNTKTVENVAAYFEVPIGVLLGHDSDEEEKLRTFPEKLCFQIAVSGCTISDVASFLGVQDEIVVGWITKNEGGYEKYYDSLSEFFHIESTYWIRPGMISPGIEPTTNEYLLILAYRDYLKNGSFNEQIYGSLSDFFPSLQFVYAEDEKKLLDSYRMLNEQDRRDALGAIRFLSKVSYSTKNALIADQHVNAPQNNMDEKRMLQAK